ncbi:NOP8-like protein [Saccharomyces kudriavzevii IFO 1802]|uniref:NOP8-like protein n=1 Tax=Saccharomyces kudriavzevii (strain ATCC MYA-4449 / AS 2.2408 / CBS 8840 / NBRC 1802 / NCYC 2889) TaxID=226230 RepID=J5RMD3_SACK1|nr:NOP8-like protein [Saccharomyces kudriavzevii IFO 1802]
MSSVIQKRVFVGNIFHDADQCYSELLDRFGKFGDCQEAQFEKHDHFAFIDVKFNDEAAFNKLKKSFNNVKFKGNVLKVDEAKPSWETTWALQHTKDLEEDIVQSIKMKKKDWEHYKKMENVAKSWKDHKEVIAGRMRKAPRKKVQLRNITFRINVDGSLKVYKCYKTKLWGYERNKELNDLVYKFTNNFWKNGYDHIVDRLDYSHAAKTIRFKSGSKQLTISQNETSGKENADSDENMSEEEKEKNNVILSGLLKDFDFDKPVPLYDSDVEPISQVGGEEENAPEEENALEEENAPEEEEEDVELADVPEVDVSERENGILQEASEKKKELDEGQEEDHEFIPTFTGEPGQGTISNTETLRSLFNPSEVETVSQFKLIEDSDNDIDRTKGIDVGQQEEEASRPNRLDVVFPVTQATKDKDTKNFLFFPHLQSPFLIGQTQVSKVRASGKETILSNWDEEFWANRGSWTRDMRRKMKDALKHRKRKQSKNGVLL